MLVAGLRWVMGLVVGGVKYFTIQSTTTDASGYRYAG